MDRSTLCLCTALLLAACSTREVAPDPQPLPGPAANAGPALDPAPAAAEARPDEPQPVAAKDPSPSPSPSPTGPAAEPQPKPEPLPIDPALLETFVLPAEAKHPRLVSFEDEALVLWHQPAEDEHSDLYAQRLDRLGRASKATAPTRLRRTSGMIEAFEVASNADHTWLGWIAWFEVPEDKKSRLMVAATHVNRTELTSPKPLALRHFSTKREGNSVSVRASSDGSGLVAASTDTSSRCTHYYDAEAGLPCNAFELYRIEPDASAATQLDKRGVDGHDMLWLSTIIETDRAVLVTGSAAYDYTLSEDMLVLDDPARPSPLSWPGCFDGAPARIWTGTELLAVCRADEDYLSVQDATGTVLTPIPTLPPKGVREDPMVPRDMVEATLDPLRCKGRQLVRRVSWKGGQREVLFEPGSELWLSEGDWTGEALLRFDRHTLHVYRCTAEHTLVNADGQAFD